MKEKDARFSKRDRYWLRQLIGRTLPYVGLSTHRHLSGMRDRGLVDFRDHFVRGKLPPALVEWYATPAGMERVGDEQ